MEDEEIISLYWERDEDAIAETDLKYGPYCRNISYAILRDQEDSRECVSDTWLHTWYAIPPQKPKNLVGFLVRIVRNLSLDRYRRKTALFRGGGQIDRVYEELEETVPSAQSGQEIADLLTLRDALERFLDRCSAEERQIFLLRYWYVHTPAEIAEQLQLRRQKVNSVLCSVRKKLRAHLEQEGIGL